jgi:hypothetical protein
LLREILLLLWMHYWLEWPQADLRILTISRFSLKKPMRPDPLPWLNEERLLVQLEVVVLAFAGTVGAGDTWELYCWPAFSSFASTAEDMQRETVALETVLRILEKQRGRANDGRCPCQAGARRSDTCIHRRASAAARHCIRAGSSSAPSRLRAPFPIQAPASSSASNS